MSVARRFNATIRLLCWAVLVLTAQSVQADRMACNPRCCPIIRTTFSAATYAREPAQRAVVLWNGTEEVLFLATDLASSAPSAMVEMVALPTEPTMRAGDLSTFNKLAALATLHNPSLALPVAMAPVGTMSNVQVKKTDALAELAAASVPIPPLLSPSPTDPICFSMVSGLKSRGFDWVVLDHVILSSTVQSFPPVEYRFKSSQVFYPVELSKQNAGDTKIDLVVITPKPLTSFSATSYPIERLGAFDLDAKELAILSPDWPPFMGSQPVVVEHLRMVGDIRKMTQDLWAH